jgi:glycosyltransferase involved in cell wall biosynthesis
MSKPRIALISYSPLAVGGIETHLLQIFHGLGKEFDFTVLGVLADPFLSSVEALGIACVPLAPAPKFGADALLRLGGEFRERRIDLVHTHDTRGGLLGRIAARRAGIPAIHTVHTPSFFLPQNPLSVQAYRLAERLLARYATDRMIFVSRTIQQIYLDGRIAAAGKARLVPNGLEAEWFQPVQHILREQTEIRFLFVGRLAREKGIGTLAAAFGIVAGRIPGARLVIAGDGPKKEELLRAAEAGGWSNRLDWLGMLSRVRARETMRTADVFVLPSDFESFSYTLLEAMACGLPCIACDVGGNRDLVEPGRTGSLVPRADARRLADEMVRLAENAEQRIAFGAEGAVRAREYTLDRMIAGTRSVYREALTRPHPQGN